MLLSAVKIMFRVRAVNICAGSTIFGFADGDRPKFCPHPFEESDQLWNPASYIGCPEIYDRLESGDVIMVENVHKQLKDGNGKLNVRVPQKNLIFTVSHALTPRLVEILYSGGMTNWIRNQSHITA